MTDWDKLWEEPWASYTKYSTTEYYDYEIWVNQVRAVGDAMQRESQNLHEVLAKTYQDLELEQAMKNQKLVESEALLQLANSRCNVLAKQLGASQEALGKLFNKLADEQKKIETVRRIIVTPDAVDLVDVSFAILAAISEPGVLKEMQEKEQQ